MIALKAMWLENVSEGHDKSGNFCVTTVWPVGGPRLRQHQVLSEVSVCDFEY